MSVVIKPGDILLWRVGPGSSWVDRLIGYGEHLSGQVNSSTINYYHVAMVGVDVLHLYDSRPGGVDNRPIPVPLSDNIEVYRMKEPLTADELKAMWSYGNSQKGVGYNWIGVLTAGLVEVLGKPFCSELVWRMATYAGRVICPWKTCLSPDDIAASSLLTRVDQ